MNKICYPRTQENENQTKKCVSVPNKIILFRSTAVVMCSGEEIQLFIAIFVCRVTVDQKPLPLRCTLKFLTVHIEMFL